jgi:hypothetical protein
MGQLRAFCTNLLARKPKKLAAIALANKITVEGIWERPG